MFLYIRFRRIYFHLVVVEMLDIIILVRIFFFYQSEHSSFVIVNFFLKTVMNFITELFSKLLKFKTSTMMCIVFYEIRE